MSHSHRVVFALSLAFSFHGFARAQDDGAAPPELRGLNYQTGVVKVGALATVALPDGWRYLQPGDARRVLEKIWNNPPNPGTLGLAFPPGGGPLEEESFAVVVSYDETGHVEDADANAQDYGALMREMQGAAREANEERSKQGFETVEVLGWAEPPHYDAKEKKLYWCKRLRFAGTPEEQLNYDVRVLGRDGCLVLTAVAPAQALDEVAEGCKELLAATAFVPGKRYEDFDPRYDKVAAYGIGGLVAGKLALKAGLFATILKFLAAGWKLVAVAVVGAASVLFRLLGRKPVEPAPVPASDGPESSAQ